ncbi:hypothetical protein CYG48_09255 [Neorhizobium sp. SOG26]|uniref:hypothetical protein n=1 Tax=Neorhizobium sp. SOG26 TaxID=2060726 RepID=UPI000E595DA8|nr:hypothetical protein [Neorhizobium sp. SOG26]AXV15869.1 hypothetical protein CYG48_09255 [Neorhizobium sp. SOG26]
MRHIGRWLSAPLLALSLAACNTTEVMTPQADIGGSGGRSSAPVTQADTERMARSSQSTGAQTPRDGYRTNPQNTLEAQARALESGNSSPAASGPAPQGQGQGQADPAQQAPQLTAAASPAAGGQTGGQASAQTSSGSIRFLPIIGAPVQAVTPLSRQLGAQARASGLTIRPSSDGSTEHILKGYFSAFVDGGNVTIIYVWDILDGTGSRLHRMQGQEKVPANGSDPWAAVPAATMETIAGKTIQDYVQWRQSRAG